MSSTRNTKPLPNRLKPEIDEYFDKLFEEIERIKETDHAFNVLDWRDSYNPLEQAAYHLCRCRNIIKNHSAQALSKKRHQNAN